MRIYRRKELVARLERTGLTMMGSHHAHGLHAPYWWLRCLVGPAKDDHRRWPPTTASWSGTS